MRIGGMYEDVSAVTKVCRVQLRRFDINHFAHPGLEDESSERSDMCVHHRG